MNKIQYKSTINEELEQYKSLKTSEEKERVFTDTLYEKDDLKIQNAILIEKLAIEKARKYAKKTEKDTAPAYYQGTLLDSDLYNEAETIQAKEPTTEETETITYTRKKRSKNNSNKNSNVFEVIMEHTLSQEDSHCTKCGSELTRVGVQEVRTYNYVPAKIERIVHQETSYKCTCCEKNDGQASFVIAKRKTAFPKCMVEHTVISHVIVQKYLAHIPLYRQEKLLTNKGMEVTRASMSNWVLKAAEVLKPLYQLLYQTILQKDICHMDETTLTVIENNPNMAYMWGLSTSKYDVPIFLYFYKENRKHQNAQDILKDFKGYVHSDGYQAYQKIDGTINIGCWAHARRKYTEITKASEEGSTFYNLAKTGRQYIDRLFAIEKQLENASIETIYQVRNVESTKVIDEYYAWIERNIHQLKPSFMITKAMEYSLNNMDSLKNYLKDGRLEISNNRAERMMKSFVMGRKNFLFCFSENGAEASSILYSIVETAMANNLNVEAYLTYLFDQLTDIKHAHLNDLLPFSTTLPKDLIIKIQ